MFALYTVLDLKQKDYLWPNAINTMTYFQIQFVNTWAYVLLGAQRESLTCGKQERFPKILEEYLFKHDKILILKEREVS